MKKINLILILMSSPFLFCSCNVSSKSESHSDSYSFTYNNCETHEHKFTGSSAEDVRNQICTALKDSRLNNGCATEQRYQMFTQKCAGMDWYN